MQFSNYYCLNEAVFHVGFWIKSDVYQEQPDIHFKHEYLLIVETDKLEAPVICSTYTYFSQIMKEHNHCTMIKVSQQITLMFSFQSFMYIAVSFRILKMSFSAVQRRGYQQGWKI